MPRFRFLAPLLALSFAVQFLLAGAGTACVGVSAGGSGATSEAMAGMDMSGTDAQSAATPSSSQHRDRPAGDQPCNRPVSQLACQVLSPCASGAVTVAALTDEQERSSLSFVLASEITTPPSRSVAPELPPPRA